MLSFGRVIAIACFLLTTVTIGVSYYFATKHGYSSLCNPFIAGCTDITHTGLKGIGGMIFRGGMISACVFILIWWTCMYVWLKPYASPVSNKLMWGFGLLASIALIVATAVLLPTKTEGPWLVHIRGANTFFQATLLATIINYRLIYVRHKRHEPVPSFKFKTVLFVLIMIVLVAFIAYGIEEYMSKGEIILEWWASFLVSFYYLSSFWDWKQLRLESRP